MGKIPGGNNEIDRVKDLTDSISGYYVALDTALQASGGSWEGILGVSVGINAAREELFAFGTIKTKLPRGVVSVGCMAAVAGACGVLCTEDPMWDDQDDTWGGCMNKCMSTVFDPRKSFGEDSNWVIRAVVIACGAAIVAGI